MITASENTRALVREVLAAAYQPDPDISVSEWAAEHRMMTSETTRTVGKWRNDRNSLLTEIMDCLSPYSPVREVTVVGPTQFGKSEIGLNWLGHTIHLAPRPFLLVRTDLGAAKNFSRNRIEKMIAASTPLQERVAAKKSRSKSNTTLLKEFPGGFLVLAGAKSAASLRDTPVACLWMDELDAYDEELEGEGDPEELAKNRTDSFGSVAKILRTSTPKHTGTSRIWNSFLRGDRSRRHLPCLHCAFYQVLRWGQLKYETDSDLQVRDVRYECERCKKEHEERMKGEMLEAGRWIAEKPERSRTHRSFQWNALYQPPGALSWSTMAQEWVMIHKPRLNVAKLKNYVMTKFAEPYQQKGEAPDYDKLLLRREPFHFGTVPHGGLVLTAGVDVQGDRIQGSVYAWGRHLERWLVDRFTIPGDTATDAPFQALEKLRTSFHYKHAGGKLMQIRSLAIDTGYRTQAVYSWCRGKTGHSVLAVDGRSYRNLPMLVGTPKQMDINFRGRRAARGVLMWPVGSGMGKEELYGWLQLSPPTKPDEPFPFGYCHLPEDADEEICRQLCAEELRINKKGRPEWVRVYEHNEALDEAIYARAAAYVLRVDHWTDAEWAELEAQMRPEPAGPGSLEKHTDKRPQAWRPRKWRPGRRQN